MTEYTDEIHAGLMAQLRERHDLAERYRVETRVLEAALRDDEYEAVSACADARAALAKAVDTLSQAMASPMGVYRAYRAKVQAGDPRVAEAEALLTLTRAVFEEVQALDRANMAALRNLMGQTAEEGKKLAKSREGIGKYAQKDLIFTSGVFDIQQ